MACLGYVKLAVACLLGLKGTPSFCWRLTSRFIFTIIPVHRR